MSEKKIKAKPLTLSQLIQFYNRTIEPCFQGLEKGMEDFRQEVTQRFQEVDGRFDNLYKKFEDLRQEYLIVNEQIKRLATGF
ncbi:MAG: hypothetical protein A3I75_06695 [Deltaproteobacteria bacterium RIFCSPLOWO2_02_FULL_50_16]|nr:MAG: hypothetical protein A2053_01030 [Deltaproteobacteria bacterium GWA2_50_8]OGQ25779.1 MAG: hypothetical protein A3B79_04585 [Deltaproteobacteria bacterium RIFCSPHIGHO2_02_FULL_50_15]OGQ57245.1 MAG: hypothetical protein A3I75_06695 [Deltaproteobacteria bacterium RIFCSPLOWO2_02_FULL_50_16]OGQ65539.1 MAG: hypothetical protein A3F89_06790 [Deltaproteobacteria bacterium RIFCSPLOWO2_12_FULL_50_11]